VVFDSSHSADPTFKGSTGSGSMVLQDSGGFFSASVNGNIALR
jgi:hypothetical protein